MATDILASTREFFKELLHQPIRLLEIGVFRGQSAKMWEEYFPKGVIIGADIEPTAKQYQTGRICIEIADQSNIADLVSLGVRHGPFDIIVDDGSHFWNHQITTLRHLFPFLKPGGFFVVEDIDTSFGAYVREYRGNSSISTFQYLQKITEYAVADTQLDIAMEEDPFIRTFARAVEFIAFHRRTAVLRRHCLPLSEWPRPGFIPQRDRDPELVAQPGFRASLIVHEGNFGDVTTIARGGPDPDYVLLGGIRFDPARTIQGFAVNLANAAAGELQYKALLNDNTWTEWTPSGNFVGSRGLGVGIRGFAVRLSGPIATQFLCTYSGSFVGHAGLVEASDGVECQAETGELEAMQIILQPHQ